MQYGVILPNVGPLAHIDSLATISHRAEELGYDSVFLSDHIVVPDGLRSAYPYRSDGRFPLTAEDRILEPVVTLSYLAAATQRIRLGFSVLVLPYRHPVLNARMLGTLDVGIGTACCNTSTVQTVAALGSDLECSRRRRISFRTVPCEGTLECPIAIHATQEPELRRATPGTQDC